MTFDLTKPVQTRDGRPARILATDLAGSMPIAAAVTPEHSAREYVETFYPDGRMTRTPGVENMGDLVNVPEPPKVRTFSVYFSSIESDVAVNETRFGTCCGRLTIDVTVDENDVPTSVELIHT